MCSLLNTGLRNFHNTDFTAVNLGGWWWVVMRGEARATPDRGKKKRLQLEQSLERY